MCYIEGIIIESLDCCQNASNIPNLGLSNKIQFTFFFRSFYVKPTGYSAKLLIVQCEAADENTELLDSVRFILQREKEIADDTVHTILLLNLPRGRNFTGYQGRLKSMDT